MMLGVGIWWHATCIQSNLNQMTDYAIYRQVTNKRFIGELALHIEHNEDEDQSGLFPVCYCRNTNEGFYLSVT